MIRHTRPERRTRQLTADAEPDHAEEADDQARPFHARGMAAAQHREHAGEQRHRRDRDRGEARADLRLGQVHQRVGQHDHEDRQLRERDPLLARRRRRAAQAQHGVHDRTGDRHADRGEQERRIALQREADARGTSNPTARRPTASARPIASGGRGLDLDSAHAGGLCEQAWGKRGRTHGVDLAGEPLQTREMLLVVAAQEMHQAAQRSMGPKPSKVRGARQSRRRQGSEQRDGLGARGCEFGERLFRRAAHATRFGERVAVDVGEQRRVFLQRAAEADAGSPRARCRARATAARAGRSVRSGSRPTTPDGIGRGWRGSWRNARAVPAGSARGQRGGCGSCDGGEQPSEPPSIAIENSCALRARILRTRP